MEAVQANSIRLISLFLFLCKFLASENLHISY